MHPGVIAGMGYSGQQNSTQNNVLPHAEVVTTQPPVPADVGYFVQPSTDQIVEPNADKSNALPNAEVQHTATTGVEITQTPVTDGVVPPATDKNLVPDALMKTPITDVDPVMSSTNKTILLDAEVKDTNLVSVAVMKTPITTDVDPLLPGTNKTILPGAGIEDKNLLANAVIKSPLTADVDPVLPSTNKNIIVLDAEIEDKILLSDALMKTPINADVDPVLLSPIKTKKKIVIVLDEEKLENTKPTVTAELVKTTQDSGPRTDEVLVEVLKEG